MATSIIQKDNPIRYISGTLASSGATSVAYPSGKDKGNFNFISIGVYRNANWYYVSRAFAVVGTNAGISLELDSSFSYFAGLPYIIYYT